MQKILLFFKKEYVNINQAALLLGFFTLLSQILGLFRDRAFAHFIGPGAQLDSYYAAFRIPDLIFISVASLASITVLIPFIVAKMPGRSESGKDGAVTKEAEKFLSDIFTVFLFTMICVSLVIFFFMPYLVDVVAPGFSHDLQIQVITLSRIMLLSPILMGLSNLFGTITQLYRKFLIYSLSPIVYNLGIIAGAVFFYPLFGIYGLALGVVLGASMHFGVQSVSARMCGFSPRLSLSVDFADIKKAILTSFPRTLGLAFNNIALISIVAFASYQKLGSVSIFNLSWNVQSVPLNIIGISYAVAVFPTLVKSYSSGDIDEFKNHLRQTARSIVFWSMPVTVLFIVIRAQIVRVLLGSGSFSWENTRLVAACLAIFSFSILSQAMITLLSRAYYATGDTKRPLAVNFICSLSIIAFAYIFLYIFHTMPMFRYFIESLFKVTDIPGTEVLMLPLAYSVGTILNFLLHLYFIGRDFMGKEPFIAKTFLQSVGSSFFIGTISYLSLNFLSPIFGTVTFWGVFLQGAISGVLGIAAGVLILYLLKNEELTELIQTFKTKFSTSKVVLAPAEEL
jgi:putative peptidoglycan lipid II flippase